MRTHLSPFILLLSNSMEATWIRTKLTGKVNLSLLYISDKFYYQNLHLKSDISHFTLIYKSCHTSYRLQFVPIRLVSNVLQWQSILYTKNKKISGLHSNITCISKCISKIYKSFSTTNSCVMYLFFILQFMFLVFIVVRSMHQQVTNCLQIRKAYNYYCSQNTHTVTHTVLKEG